MLTIEPSTGSAPDLTAGVASAIALTVAHLTGPVLGNAFDVNMGLRGMTKLAGELRDRRGKTGWAHRFGGGAAFAHARRRLDECLQREYTASDATRPIYADFLNEAAPLLPSVDLPGAAALIQESGRHWSAVSAAALSGDDADPAALFDILADHVEAAVEAESSAVRMLGPTA